MQLRDGAREVDLIDADLRSPWRPIWGDDADDASSTSLDISNAEWINNV